MEAYWDIIEVYMDKRKKRTIKRLEITGKVWELLWEVQMWAGNRGSTDLRDLRSLEGRK